MTKRDPDDVPPSEAALRRDAALLKMLKTPHKKHADSKKPRAKKAERPGPLEPWKPR